MTGHAPSLTPGQCIVDKLGCHQVVSQRTRVVLHYETSLQFPDSSCTRDNVSLASVLSRKYRNPRLYRNLHTDGVNAHAIPLGNFIYPELIEGASQAASTSVVRTRSMDLVLVYPLWLHSSLF